MTDDTPSGELPKRLDSATVTPLEITEVARAEGYRLPADTEFTDTGGFVCPPSEAEEFIRRAKSAGLAESIHIEFVTSEEVFRYPPRDPSQPKPTGEPFVVLDPESQTVKPATIFGKPVVYEDLGLGDGDIFLADPAEVYKGIEFVSMHGHQEATAITDNGDATFTHTFEAPQGQIPKEITISGHATFTPEFEQWLEGLERMRDSMDAIMLAFGDALAPAILSFKEFGAALVAAGIEAGIIRPLPLLPGRRWAKRAFINSLAKYGTGYPGPLPTLVYKSNPMRRKAKSERIHARRMKRARRK